MNRPSEALASFDRAIALRPDYLEALVNKASMLGALQRFDEALRFGRHAISMLNR